MSVVAAITIICASMLAFRQGQLEAQAGLFNYRASFVYNFRYFIIFACGVEWQLDAHV
jgi:hypothetical protein